jgi:hypothetical protein
MSALGNPDRFNRDCGYTSPSRGEWSRDLERSSQVGLSHCAGYDARHGRPGVEARMNRRREADGSPQVSDAAQSYLLALRTLTDGGATTLTSALARQLGVSTQAAS